MFNRRIIPAEFTVILIGKGQSMLDANSDFKERFATGYTMAEVKRHAESIAEFHNMDICVLSQKLLEGEERLAA